MAEKTVIHVLESMGAGTLTSVSQICNYLCDNGVSVHLIFSPLREETPENWRDYFNDQVVTYRVDMRRQLSPHSDLLSVVRVSRILSQVNADVVHAHSSKAGAITRLAALFSRNRASVYYSPRGFGFLQLNYSRMTRSTFFVMEKLLAKVCGQIVACSQSELMEAQQLSSRSTLIENSIDRSRLIEKHVRQPGERTVRVGTLGRIGRQKDPKLFSEVADAVRETFGDSVEFVWIGGGDIHDQSRLEKANCTVTGWVPRPVALEQLSRLDIYLQTSSWEGMPLSVIESQMIGIPGVVTNVIGNRDVIEDKVTGFICDDKQSLVRSVSDLVMDERLRAKLGEAARKIGVQRFSVSRMGREYMALYGFDTKQDDLLTSSHTRQLGQAG